MKNIIFNNVGSYFLEDVPVGEFFTVQGELYMKVSEIENSSGYHINCVNIQTGKLITNNIFSESKEVIRVNVNIEVNQR